MSAYLGYKALLHDKVAYIPRTVSAPAKTYEWVSSFCVYEAIPDHEISEDPYK